MTQTDFLIGRSSSCGLRLCEGLVSRRHARIVLSADGAMIEDLRSRNGVRVNGAKIKRTTLLRHRDSFTIGAESITLIDEALSDRHESLSTLPPLVPDGESDADQDDTLTMVVRLDRLSKREKEVFELIVHGFTQRQIAERLFVSVKTIESHRTHIGEKLECKSRAELVRCGIVGGVLRPKSSPGLEANHNGTM